MSTKKSKGAYHHGALRHALLDAAVTMIGEKGVEGLSLRALARELGVSHGAPARHFPTRNDLLAAIVEDAYRDLIGAVYEAGRNAPAAGDAAGLNAMARAALEWAMAHPARFSVMTNPDVSRFAGEEVRASLGDFAELVESGIAAAGDALPGALPQKEYLLFAVGAVIGIATLLTDDLMRAILNADTDADTAARLAELIVPAGLKI